MGKTITWCRRNLFRTAFIVVLLIGIVTLPVSAREADVTRVWGDNRFETSFAIADYIREQDMDGKFDAIMIASGKNFPDALSGTYLAARINAPILMAGNRDDAALVSYIRSYLHENGKIYILGGENAVSLSLDEKLKDYDIQRLSGGDRFDTNLMILNEAAITGGEILVCTGLDFADSLSASATGLPIFLINNKTGKLTESQKSFLTQLTNPTFTVIGGEKAVSEAIASQISNYGTLRRIGGSNRLETSRLIADTYFKEPKTVVFAYAKNFPDGLCGGPLAHELGGPVILTIKGKEKLASEYVQSADVSSGIVLGGEKIIPDGSVRQIYGLDSGANIPSYGNFDYSIYYELGGGIQDPSNPRGYYAGTTVKLHNPTRENYDFAGWYLEKACVNRIYEITPDQNRDLTLYARWTLKALNLQGEGLEDMIWSWWYYPQVVSDDDAVFWGYTTHDGYCGIARYDRTNGAVTKNALKLGNTSDDHNGLALTTMDDGRIMCVYAGGHDYDFDIHVRISDGAGDISKFSTHVILRSSGKTCYGQILKYGNKYHIFYRTNNNSWGTRCSGDGINWSDEVVLITSKTQYYCRFMPTTQDGLVRICMTSNPTAKDPRIRMGFLNLDTGELLNSDAKTVLGKENVFFDTFDVLLTPPDGKIQRLFDVAISAPDEPKILYTQFTGNTGSNDSIYYLYDSGVSHKICDGGVPLWDPKYQLGASFLDEDTIVAGYNSLGTDYIQLFQYDGNQILPDQVIDTQSGTSWSRNGRPITDIYGKTVIWHNGYYNPKNYRDFHTDARLYLMEEDKRITMSGSDIEAEKLQQVKQTNIESVKAYADRLYQENISEDYLHASFTWDRATRSSNWIYFTGLVYESFLETDFVKYSPEIRAYFNQHINEDGKIKGYIIGELDSAMLSAVMLRLLNEGNLNAAERELYAKAAQFTYSQLENQTIYPQAGNLWLHSQKSDGSPRDAWGKWNICLDGIYMSQMFIIRLAESIDLGNVTILDKDGNTVTSRQLWDDITARLSFVVDHMRNTKTGLLNHGYCAETGQTNNAVWGRGMGWYTMVLMEAAEKCPDATKKAELTQDFKDIMGDLLPWQDPCTFLWYNVVDGREEYVYEKVTESGTEMIYNQPETSGSAMFAYCLLKGHKLGLLPEEQYAIAGMRAFNAMAETRLTEEGLTDIYHSSSVTSNKNLYQKNGFTTNDGKGVGPFILAMNYAN